MGTTGGGAGRRAAHWAVAVARTLVQHLTAALIVLGGLLGGAHISPAVPDIRPRRPLGGDRTPCAPLTPEEERAWAASVADLQGTPRGGRGAT